MPNPEGGQRVVMQEGIVPGGGMALLTGSGGRVLSSRLHWYALFKLGHRRWRHNGVRPAPQLFNMTRLMPAPSPLRSGLDFCNHNGSSACKWTVFGAEAAAGGRKLRRGEQPDAVSLVCPRRAVPRPGSEVTINYGAQMVVASQFCQPGKLASRGANKLVQP